MLTKTPKRYRALMIWQNLQLNSLCSIYLFPSSFPPPLLYAFSNIFQLVSDVFDKSVLSFIAFSLWVFRERHASTDLPRGRRVWFCSIWSNLFNVFSFLNKAEFGGTYYLKLNSAKDFTLHASDASLNRLLDNSTS